MSNLIALNSVIQLIWYFHCSLSQHFRSKYIERFLSRGLIRLKRCFCRSAVMNPGSDLFWLVSGRVTQEMCLPWFMTSAWHADEKTRCFPLFLFSSLLFLPQCRIVLYSLFTSTNYNILCRIHRNIHFNALRMFSTLVWNHKLWH